MPSFVYLNSLGLHTEKRTRDGVEHVVSRPRSAAELLYHWNHEVVGIAPTYTLGDLLNLLRGVRDFDVLSPLLSCDADAFLREKPARKHKDSSIRYLAVYNIAEVIDDDSGKGSPKQPAGRGRSTRVSPGNLRYVVTRGFHGKALMDDSFPGFAGLTRKERNGEMDIGLSLSRLEDLARFPLRYDPKVSFCPDWTIRTPNPKPYLETQMGITFGEMISAMFGEIGFYGSTPHARNLFNRKLDAAIPKRGTIKTRPWREISAAARQKLRARRLARGA